MVKLICSRSDTFKENWKIPDYVPSEITLGPYEYVEFTYEGLRVGPHGDHIGHYNAHDGCWKLEDMPTPFSDLDIFSV